MATSDDEEREERKTNKSQQERRDRGQSGSSGEKGAKRVPIAKAMRLAAGQLADLLGCEPDSVSSVKATSEGWTAEVEVVEVERIPDTTSVMGTYRVQLDGEGNLLGYERTRRYARGQIDQRS